MEIFIKIKYFFRQRRLCCPTKLKPLSALAQHIKVVSCNFSSTKRNLKYFITPVCLSRVYVRTFNSQNILKMFRNWWMLFRFTIECFLLKIGIYYSCAGTNNRIRVQYHVWIETTGNAFSVFNSTKDTFPFFFLII